MKHLALALAVSAPFCCGGLLQADPILYTDQFTGSGSLGANDFTDSLVTISFLGDTSNATLLAGTPGGTHIYINSTGTATVTIAGVGTANFTDAMQAESLNFATTPPGDAEIIDLDTNAFWGTANSTFIPYDLGSDIGPVSGASQILDTNEQIEFDNMVVTYSPANTDAGLFTVSSFDDTSAFSAAAPTPESNSFPLFGIGIAGMVAVSRARGTRRTPAGTPAAH